MMTIIAFLMLLLLLLFPVVHTPLQTLRETHLVSGMEVQCDRRARSRSCGAVEPHRKVPALRSVRPRPGGEEGLCLPVCLLPERVSVRTGSANHRLLLLSCFSFIPPVSFVHHESENNHQAARTARKGLGLNVSH
ncbi:uncharacterized [Lates japonicus]